MTVSSGLSLPHFDLCCCQPASSESTSQFQGEPIREPMPGWKGGIRHQLNHRVYRDAPTSIRRWRWWTCLSSFVFFGSFFHEQLVKYTWEDGEVRSEQKWPRNFQIQSETSKLKSLLGKEEMVVLCDAHNKHTRGFSPQFWEKGKYSVPSSLLWPLS